MKGCLLSPEQQVGKLAPATLRHFFNDFLIPLPSCWASQFWDSLLSLGSLLLSVLLGHKEPAPHLAEVPELSIEAGLRCCSPSLAWPSWLSKPLLLLYLQAVGQQSFLALRVWPDPWKERMPGIMVGRDTQLPLQTCCVLSHTHHAVWDAGVVYT